MRHRFYISLLALAALALILAACTSNAEPTPSAPPAQTAEVVQQDQQESVLLDTAWTVRTFGGAGEAILVVPDSFPSVNLMGERYSGYTGCNYYLGTYGVDGSTLRMTWPAITKGVYENDVLFRQEDMFLSGLNATTRYEIDGDNLVLYVVDDQVMTLAPLEPVPCRPQPGRAN